MRKPGIRSGLLAVVIVALVSSLWSNARAVDAGATGGNCTLPSGQSLDCSGLNANVCDAYNALCNPQTSLCVCKTTTGDGGTTRGDGGTRSDGGGGTGGSGGGMTGGSTGGSTPILGGGMTQPARTGCSFVPGAR